MTCQPGPSIANGTAPARQPLEWMPIERAGPRYGVALRANSSLAGVDASGFCNGGSGSGFSEPGSIGASSCVCCASAEPTARGVKVGDKQQFILVLRRCTKCFPSNGPHGSPAG